MLSSTELWAITVSLRVGFLLCFDGLMLCQSWGVCVLLTWSSQQSLSVQLLNPDQILCGLSISLTLCCAADQYRIQTYEPVIRLSVTCLYDVCARKCHSLHSDVRLWSPTQSNLKGFFKKTLYLLSEFFHLFIINPEETPLSVFAVTGLPVITKQTLFPQKNLFWSGVCPKWLRGTISMPARQAQDTMPLLSKRRNNGGCHSIRSLCSIKYASVPSAQGKTETRGGEGRKRLGMEICADALEQCAGVSQLRMWAAGRCCVFYIFLYVYRRISGALDCSVVSSITHGFRWIVPQCKISHGCTRIHYSTGNTLQNSIVLTQLAGLVSHTRWI